MAVNNQKSKLVEEQINKLLTAKSNDGDKEQKFSPMVKKLLENESQEKNVHKLKRMFEEKFSHPTVRDLAYDDEK